MNPIAERLLERSRGQGADEAEVFISHGSEFTVKVFKGEIESLVSAESRGVGLRTLREHRLGFAYTSDLAPEALDALADEALRNGRFNHPDEANVLPDPEGIEPLEGLYSSRLASIEPQRKIQFALELEQRTVSLNPRVKRVSDSVYADGDGHVEIYNSRGLRAQFDRSVAYGVVEAIAEQDSEMQSGFAFTYGRDLEALDLLATAREAVARSSGLLGARRVATATVPVVLDPLAAGMILGVISSSFSADAVQKQRSLLAGKVGQPIASELVTIVDDARFPDGLASRPFDGEGVPSRRTALVVDGVLQGYLHNTYTARRAGERSTASASRSYKSVPHVGVSNISFRPGTLTRQALLQQVGNGLYVSQLHGLHTVNPASGDFSLGLSGHWIHRGDLTQPVRELTVAGNLIELLKKVAGVADDLRFNIAGGFCGSPTLLIEELPVGGT